VLRLTAGDGDMNISSDGPFLSVTESARISTIVPMHSGLFMDLEKRLKSMTELGSKAWYDLNGLYVYITVVFLVKVFKICNQILRKN
jgi:hypothetical protein